MSQIQKQNTLCVYIGRFSPFHDGQAAVLKHALQKYSEVLVIIGTHNEARTIKNPWTCLERAQMILDWKTFFLGNLSIKFAEDFPYNNILWASNINQLVEEHIALSNVRPKIYLTGTERDATGFYLKMFPQWEKDLFTDTSVPHSLSATLVREVYFGNTLSGKPILSSDYAEQQLNNMMPKTSVNYLQQFKKTVHYQQLLGEYQENLKSKEAWKSAPYPPIFVTIDAVVVQASHVLMITRKNSPGKGLLALPGGFLEQEEWLIDGAIRELQEETDIKLAPRQLRGSICAEKIFDNPFRSLRGRTITVAYLVQLNEVGKLAKVKAKDDAAEVGWYSINELNSRKSEIFEDHWHIIQSMLGYVGRRQ